MMHLEFNNNEHLEYDLDDKTLNKTVQEKDLGVLTPGTLLWNDQIESCVSKANQMLCWISRNLISREKSLMLRVYKTLIRPHLEYCVQLWNPAAEQWRNVTMCRPPPLIAICRPYLEPARFARRNLSLEIPFYLAQI